LAGGGDSAAARIGEVWGFDCTYNGGDDTFWAGWAQAHPDARVYVYYIAKSKTEPLARSLGRLGGPNVVVRASRDARHDYVPITYWRERIEGAPFLTQRGGGSSPSVPPTTPPVPPSPATEADVDVGKLTHDQFLEFVGPHAKAAMAETGVPASVTVAQAILESGWGRHAIGRAKNLFGIKGRGPAGSVRATTREFVNGRWITQEANFAAYKTYAESIAEHARFFRRNRRYAEALRHVDDADRFAREIHRAGYATAPNYADALISLMRRHNLYRFDRR
jgi:hypothetical protein